MSALLRALMAQQTESEKSNLAVITDVLFDIDSQNSEIDYTETRSGLTGVIQPKLPYRYILDYDVNLDYVDDGSWFSIGNQPQWGGVESLLPKVWAKLGKNTGHIDIVVAGGKWDYGAEDEGFIRFYHKHCKGTVHLYNFRIEEV